MVKFQACFKLKASSSGQQLMEFSLVIGLVSLVSIGTLLLSSQGIANQLADFLGGSSSQSTTALAPTNTQKPPLIASNPLPNLGAPFQLPPPKPNQTRICNEQGICLNVLSFRPGQTAQEVAGGNGAESLIYSYSENLLQLRDQLALKGEDPALLDIITRLANSGHKLGESYPDMFKNCTPRNLKNDPNNRCSMKHSLRPEELADYKRLGIDGMTTYKNAGRPDGSAQEQLRNVSNEFSFYMMKKYNNQNWFQDPVYQIVQYHTNQIQTIASGFGGNSSRMDGNGNISFELFQTNNAKLQTFEEANGICQTGGDMQQCFRPVQVPLENNPQQAASI